MIRNVLKLYPVDAKEASIRWVAGAALCGCYYRGKLFLLLFLATAKKNLRIYLFAILTTTLLCCNQETKLKGPDSYPSEWMHYQRAYPYDHINPNSVKEALKIYEQKKNENAKGLLGTWESEGPFNISGRVTDIARHPTHPGICYVGTSVGGVFKTVDNFASWTPITEDIPTLSVGDIAISKSNPSVLYLGTGEANGSATSGSFFGSGVYKSEDSGATWEQKGLENANHFGRIVIDDQNPDLAYAAVTGTLYGTDSERGLYKTENGGDSWEQLLFVNDSVGCIDVVVSPFNKDIIYAAMWERTRYPWIRDYGGPAAGIYQSKDGGQTWNHLQGDAYGLPESTDETGRTGLAISKTTPGVVFAVTTTNAITNRFNGVYKSTDDGNSWEEITGDLDPNVFSSFGWFFGQIRVDPTDDDIIYVLGQRSFRSLDGGQLWDEIYSTHVDAHAMEFLDTDPKNVLLGDDSGIHQSLDLDSFFVEYENLPITQFYEIEVDYLNPENVLGGTQDNGTMIKTGNLEYSRIYGGDGFHVKVDPTNSNIIYAEYQFGGLGISYDGGQSFEDAVEGIDTDERTNWNTPVFLSPYDPKYVFYGAEKLYKSEYAQNWEAVSPDLTNGQHISGSGSFGTITAIGLSSQDIDVMYAGTDDGNVWTSRNGSTWVQIDQGLPNRYVNHITVNPYNDLEAVVCFSGYRAVDYEAHVLRTRDGGQSWEDISGDLPEVPANDFIYDLDLEDRYYLATDLGVWFTENQGQNWELLGDGLPLSIANDMVFHGPTRTLYVGTFGRSIYSIDLSDDVSAIQDELDLDVLLYPNPVSNILNLEFKQKLNQQYAISIFTKDGKELVEKLDLNGNQELKVNLGHLTTGQYFLIVTDRTGVQLLNKSFVKI